MPEPVIWDETDYNAAGLFGVIRDASVQNLILTDVNISAYDSVGGIAGEAYDSVISGITVTGNISGVAGLEGGGYLVGGAVGTLFSGVISGVEAYGVVAGINQVGGLVGFTNQSTITYSGTGNSVSGDSYVGGLVGETYSSSIISCGAAGAVSGSYLLVGGLVGSNHYNSSIIDSVAEGSVTGLADSLRCGGLVGENSSNSVISQSSASGAVIGKGQIGGLVGVNIYNSSVVNSCAFGSVTSNYDTVDEIVAGLVGWNGDGSTVAKSYAVGQVNGSGWRHGGLVGYNYMGNPILSCFSLGPNNGFGTVVTDEAMKMQVTFTDWDFVNVWGIEEGVTYPYHVERTADYDIVEVTAIDDITAALGTPLVDVQLPALVRVRTDAGSTSYLYLPVSWDGGTPSYDGNTIGAYTFTGTISTVLGVANTSELTASVTVNVIVILPDKEIVSVQNLSDIDVPYGTLLSEIPLPESVQVTLDDASKADLTVNWDEGTPAYDGNISATYGFTGTLNTVDGIANSGDYLAAVNVKVGVQETPQTPPSITLQPLDCQVKLGEIANFTLEYSAYPLPAIQWQLSTNNGKKWNNIPAATSASYSIQATNTNMNGYKYRAILSNTLGSATTNAATLTITMGQADVRVTQGGIYDSNTGVITWEITVTNLGPDTAHGVEVNTTLLNRTKVQSVNSLLAFYYKIKGRTVTEYIGDLYSGDIEVITIEALVSRAVLPIDNTVTVTTTSLDEDQSNNTAISQVGA